MAATYKKNYELLVNLKLGKRFSNLFFEAAGLDGIQKPQGSDPDDLSGVLGQVEGDLDVGLGR